MTYSVSITGHSDKSTSDEKALLVALMDALEMYGGEVTIFTFSGDDVQVPSYEAAKDEVSIGE